MLFLVLSIVCSVSVSVLMKLARKHQIDVSQAVAVNYWVAIAWTLLVLRPKFDNQLLVDHMGIFGVLGVLMPAGFLVLGRAVAEAGIVKTDAAQRLSLFLPVLAAFTIFGEVIKLQNILGLILAFSALACLLYKPNRQPEKPTHQWNSHTMWILLWVWLTYGTVDILFKQLAKMGAKTVSINLLITFSIAAIIMLIYLLMKKTRWDKISLLSGLLLGSLNFGNIIFYIHAHMAFQENPTTVFAGMNMGVIALGTLVGAWYFKEKISRLNAVGIGLALMAVLMLSYGNLLFLYS